MQSIDHSTYEALRAGAHVLEADGSGDKVLRLADGRMLKLFRRKRAVSSALFYPYAQRFADNTRELEQRGVLCPTTIAVYRIPSIERDCVYYSPLAGQTIRQVLGSANDAENLRSELGSFIAELHEKGVYFRSLHLGNVVLTPSDELGLIDIADLRCRKHALSDSKRLRNFAHLLRYKQDKQWLLGQDEGKTFLQGYTQALPPKRQAPMVQRLQQLLTHA